MNEINSTVVELMMVLEVVKETRYKQYVLRKKEWSGKRKIYYDMILKLRIERKIRSKCTYSMVNNSEPRYPMSSITEYILVEYIIFNLGNKAWFSPYVNTMQCRHNQIHHNSLERRNLKTIKIVYYEQQRQWEIILHEIAYQFHLFKVIQRNIRYIYITYCSQFLSAFLTYLCIESGKVNLQWL